MRKPFFSWTPWVAVVCLGVAAGCTPSQHAQPLELRYGFDDSGRYRVDATYQLRIHLEKNHRKKTFLNQRQELFVKTSYRLEVQHLPGEKIQAVFRPLRVRIHDQAGRFKLEIGPESGWLSWYGEEQTLQEYLGPEAFNRYRMLFSQPLAIVTINAQGTQAVSPEMEFNFNLIKCLGKNRVIGEWVVKSLKVPPVLMLLFPARPVGVGESWSLANSSTPEQSTEWTQPLATTFTLRSAAEGQAVVRYEGGMDISGSELLELRNRLGLKALQDVRFDRSQFTLDGEVEFLIPAARPKIGSMNIVKSYTMRIGDETWNYASQEEHRFSLQAEP